MEYILKCVLSMIVAGSTVYFYHSYFSTKKKDKHPESQALFFYETINCRRVCIQKHIICGANCASLKQNFLEKLIFSTEKTLDICMFLCTNSQLAKAIINVSERGVKVRIIVDENMSNCRESKVLKFIEAGLMVKSNLNYKTTNMHNKFCIIDGELENNRKLITGSLNWTLQAMTSNFENVIITSKETLIRNYTEMFDYMWDLF